MYTFKAPILYVPAFVLLVIWFVFKIFSKKNKLPVRRLILISLFYLYIILVFGVTLFPIDTFPMEYPPGHNFIPFHTIIQLLSNQSMSIALKQIFGNIIMFMPFGFLVPFFSKTKKFAVAFIGSLSFSILIEFLQFLLGIIVVGSQYRSVDIDDVILNTIGGLIGFCIFVFTPHFIKDPYLKTDVPKA